MRCLNIFPINNQQKFKDFCLRLIDITKSCQMEENQPSTSKKSRMLSSSNQLNNNSPSSSNSTTGGTEENDIKRRKTAFKYQAKIRDEIRKAEQGIASGTKIAELFENVTGQREGDSEESIGKMRTLKVDGQTLQQLTKLSITEMHKLCHETSKTLDPDLLIAKMKTYSMRIQPSHGENVFSALGKRYTSLMRSIPDFYYLRPCFEITKDPKLRQKPPRKLIKREKKQHQEIKAKTLNELREEESDKTSVSKELDNVKRHLRAVYKQTASNEVDYYRFVINPDEHSGFGETIENMFYVSFLIKDGHVRLQIDPNTGCPKIVKLSRDEREQQMQNIQETVQLVSRLDYTTWQRLVKKLGLKEAHIKRRPIGTVRVE